MRHLLDKHSRCKCIGQILGQNFGGFWENIVDYAIFR